MINGMKNSYRRWRTYVFIGFSILFLFLLLAWLSENVISYLIKAQSHSTGIAPPIIGEQSLEERILAADVIARVKLLSVSESAEPLVDSDKHETIKSDGLYIPALMYNFEVIEYLKGSGSERLKAIVHSGIGGSEYVTYNVASARGKLLLKHRNPLWDDREAIIFLNKGKILATTEQADHYVLGAAEPPGRYDYYTIYGGHSKKWLPAAAPGGVSGPSGSNAQRFLTGAPYIEGGSAEEVAKQGSSIDLGEIKTLIAQLQAELNAGDGSEEYRKCVTDGYWWTRHIRDNNFNDLHYDHDLESGLPAGRRAYEDWRTYHTREASLANPHLPHPDYWLEGMDADLFYVEHPGVVYTARPLPEGEYQMYYQVRAHKYIICDAYPESERTAYKYVVHVKPPADTLHEAFFDPVDDGDGSVGADGSNGVIKPDTFDMEGTSETTIRRIDWSAGNVRMQLNPHNGLAGHHIDFIALDASVSLRLDFDDAVEIEEDGAAALAWGVCEQPWQDGDLLMIRISESGGALTDPTPTNDAECAPAAPTATPTAEAAPEPTTPEPTATEDAKDAATPTPEPAATPAPETESAEEPTATPAPQPTATPTP